jgi:hypothetical protein
LLLQLLAAERLGGDLDDTLPPRARGAFSLVSLLPIAVRRRSIDERVQARHNPARNTTDVGCA